MTNLNEHYKEKVSAITKTLEGMKVFNKIEVDAYGGNIEHNADSESFGVDDTISIQAWHINDNEYGPTLDITITAGAFISGCPCSEDERYVDEDGDFDEDKYYADVSDALESMDADEEERMNCLINSIGFDGSNGEFSFSVEFHSGMYGGWNAEELDELNEYLQSDTFANELAEAVAEEEAA